MFTHLLAIYLISQVQTVCELGDTPVCGQDMRTYPDICSLINSRVQLLLNRPCPTNQEEGCSMIFQPVCGKDAVTYLNMCTME